MLSRLTTLLIALLLLLGATSVVAQNDGEGDGQSDGQGAAADSVAGVRVDGRLLFRVRGISAYPARVRAAAVSDRILNVARDRELPPGAIAFTAVEDYYLITAGDVNILRLYEFDAALEGIPLPVLAEVITLRITDVVRKYREDRAPGALRRSSLYTAGLTIVLLVLLWGLRRLRSWLENWLRRRVEASMETLERQSGAALHRGHLWNLSQGVLQGLWYLVLLVIAYFYLSSVLGTFPWTRSFSLRLLDYVRDPLVSMGDALLHSVPNLVFLVILWFLVRYLLRTLRNFFNALRSRRLRLRNFEPEWADPTYRLLRIAIIAFAVVVAYPYIPGSESAAFKGVSIFLGVLLSLGSTSFIANLIAGIALTYRGVFQEGDWVDIDGADGRVEEIRAQVVRLRTRDNELVSIPSSTILNANVTNLSRQADGQGLVLRSRISLGYDVDWRRAEALLLEAAGQTEGILDTPPPWVQVNELGNFAVDYTLVVRIEAPGPLPRIRTRLNQAILDRFHGAGIQIMSPTYEQDPEQPKIPRQTEDPS